jgi:hypothetical protein
MGLVGMDAAFERLGIHLTVMSTSKTPQIVQSTQVTPHTFACQGLLKPIGEVVGARRLQLRAATRQRAANELRWLREQMLLEQVLAQKMAELVDANATDIEGFKQALHHVVGDTLPDQWSLVQDLTTVTGTTPTRVHSSRERLLNREVTRLALKADPGN